MAALYHPARLGEGRLQFDMQPWALMRSMSRDPEDTRGMKLERHTLRRVLKYARPYRKQLIVFVVLIVAAAGTAVIPPLLFARLIDVAIPEGDKTMVIALSSVALGIALFDGILNLVQRWLSAVVGEGLIYDLRTELYDHVQRMPIAFFTRTQTGALISRLNTDVIGAQRALTGTLSQILTNVVTVAATLVVMFLLSWPITIIALLVLPVFLILARWVGRRLRVITRDQMNLDASMTAMMSERFNVAGALLVKLFGRSDRELGEFSSRAEQVRDIGVGAAVYTRTFMVSLAFVAAVATALLYLIGGLSVIGGTMQIGVVVALSLYLTRLYPPLTALTTARVDYLTAMVSFERVFEVIDLDHPIAEHPGSIKLADAQGEVGFDHVTFTYPGGAGVTLATLQDPGHVPTDDDEREAVLVDVSFEISPGEMVALVGPSGAGKTTISLLLPRLYDVDSGHVTVDGHDVRDLTLESLNAAMGVVTQDPHLFHDSIAANLRFAKHDATDAELEAACQSAHIHHVIAALPDGYDTVVGERGYRLSGGEKQRLALARVFLKDPAIIILDEATAHLDSESERLVQEALDEVLHGRSSVVIAHRLSTVRAADKILVIVDGRIAESGTHDELLTAGGTYAGLYETQFAPRAAL